MSQPMAGPPGRRAAPAPHNLNLHGAVDLSALANRRPGPGGGAPAAGPGTAGPGAAGPGSAGGASESGATGGLILEVNEANFAEVVQGSAEVPLILNITSARSDASVQLTPVLEKLTREYAGRFRLAHIDADSNAQIAQALQVQALPTVVAVLGGRPAPLFQGAYPEDQVRQVLDEVLRLAAQSGVTGTASVESVEEDNTPSEPELPPLHAEAMAAIERGDLNGAEDAYTRAIKENPGDTEAEAAREQIRLIRRAQQHDAAEALAAAAEAGPTDVSAQLIAADVEAASGQFGPAFERLLGVIRVTAGDDREQARLRLVEFFGIAGPAHPEVGRARKLLASALF